MPKRQEENQEQAGTRMPREMASGLGDKEVVGNFRETSSFNWREEARAFMPDKEVGSRAIDTSSQKLHHKEEGWTTLFGREHIHVCDYMRARNE